MFQILNQYLCQKPVTGSASRITKENTSSNLPSLSLTALSNDQFRNSSSQKIRSTPPIHFSGDTTPKEYTELFEWWQKQREETNPKNQQYVLHKEHGQYNLKYIVKKESDLLLGTQERYLRRSSDWSCSDAVKVYNHAENKNLSNVTAKKYLQQEQKNNQFTDLPLKDDSSRRKRSKSRSGGSASESDVSSTGSTNSQRGRPKKVKILLTSETKNIKATSSPQIESEEVEAHLTKVVDNFRIDDFVGWIIGLVQTRDDFTRFSWDGLFAAYSLRENSGVSGIKKNIPVFSNDEIDEIKEKLRQYNHNAEKKYKINHLSLR